MIKGLFAIAGAGLVFYGLLQENTRMVMWGCGICLFGLGWSSIDNDEGVSDY